MTNEWKRASVGFSFYRTKGQTIGIDRVYRLSGCIGKKLNP
jgi:hypothetical protein